MNSAVGLFAHVPVPHKKADNFTVYAHVTQPITQVRAVGDDGYGKKRLEIVSSIQLALMSPAETAHPVGTKRGALGR